MRISATANCLSLTQAPYLVRELLLISISENNIFTQKTLRFLRRAPPNSLLKFSKDIIRSKAISISFISNHLKEVVFSSKKGFKIKKSLPNEKNGFQNIHMVRQLVMILSDAIYNRSSHLDNIFSVNTIVKKFLLSANSEQIECFCFNVIEFNCVNISFSPKKIESITFYQISIESREKIKDYLVTNRATCAFMKSLFGDENEHSVRHRKNRIGLKPLIGRPRSAEMTDIIEFIHFWANHQEKTDLDRFILIHKNLNLPFDTLWSIYQKSESEGDFDPKLLESFKSKPHSQYS
jgi:hypothetical protein